MKSGVCKHMRKTYLPNSTYCFVCGEKNAAGLNTRFYVEEGVVKTPLTATPHHCGYRNVVHGGVTAAVLDECMGWAAARAIKRMCLTGELTIRYLKPVPCDGELTVCAEVAQAKRRFVRVTGRVVDEQGTEYVRAQGTFVPLSAEETLAVDGALLYRGGEERVFDELRVGAGTGPQAPAP